MTNKLYSQACENNKTSILNVLMKELQNSRHLLEIGSGTGQHTVFLAKHLQHLTWQPSDLSLNHESINAWIKDYPAKNIQKPIEFDLNNPWPKTNIKTPIDTVFTANTLHIISWQLVIKFFKSIADNLSKGATLCIYGPFKYKNKFTSESNANFDLWLKERDINSGVRDFENIIALADSAKLYLKHDYPMPANNQLLVFIKK